MSASGTVSISRNRGENRFYNPPHRRQQQQQQQQRQQEPQQQQREKQHRRGASSISRNCCSSSSLASTTSSLSKSDCSVSDSGLGGGGSGSTNFDRFLEHTTPVVPAQYFPKVISAKVLWIGWKNVFRVLCVWVMGNVMVVKLDLLLGY